MPELPEVETIKLQLSRVLPGETIKNVEVRAKKIFPGDPKRVVGKKIIKLRRFSKALVIDLSGGTSLVVHLKLTGRLVYANHTRSDLSTSERSDLKYKWDTAYQTDKHTHVVITFVSGDKLYFHDLRKFGWIQIVETDQVEELPYIKKLGPEFFRDLTEDKFLKLLKGTRLPIKIALMDQQKLGGVGNIYANEGLWCAKINPKTKANTLSDGYIVTLFNCLEKILKDAIRWGGASDNNYRDAFGEKGRVQEHFLVYNQAGKPCSRCKTLIKKIQLGGRGTYFCPRCQQ